MLPTTKATMSDFCFPAHKRLLGHRAGVSWRHNVHLRPMPCWDDLQQESTPDRQSVCFSLFFFCVEQGPRIHLRRPHMAGEPMAGGMSTCSQHLGQRGAMQGECTKRKELYGWR